MLQASWLCLLRQEVEHVLTSVGVSREFHAEIMSGLKRPGSVFHSETSSPKSSLVFLFALGLSGCCEHVVPAALAIELSLAACNLLDSIEDEEGAAGLLQAQTLNQATSLLLLSHVSLGRLWERNEPARARHAARVFENATVRSCQGQALDLSFEGRDTVTEQEYLQMVEWKSAAPLSCACSLGALLAVNEEDKIEAAGQYGKWLGMARQVGNDAFAVALGENKSDIRRRKKTLPVIYALGSAQGGDREFLHRVYRASKGPLPDEEAHVRDIISAVGGVHYAMVVAEIYRQRAMAQVERTGVTGDIGDMLRRIASY